MNTYEWYVCTPHEDLLRELKSKTQSEAKQYEKQYWQYIVQEQSYHETVWTKLSHFLPCSLTTQWLQLPSLPTTSPLLLEQITTSAETFFKIFASSLPQPAALYSLTAHQVSQHN